AVRSHRARAGAARDVMSEANGAWEEKRECVEAVAAEADRFAPARPIRVSPEFMPKHSAADSLRKIVGFFIVAVSAVLLLVGYFMAKGVMGNTLALMLTGLLIIAIGFVVGALGAAVYFHSRRHLTTWFQGESRDDDLWAAWPWLG